METRGPAPLILDRPIDRRTLLKRGLIMGAALAAGPALLSPVQAFAAAPVRRIALTNLHTGERCALTYCEHGLYIPGAMETIASVLRDHRSNETHPIDPALIDLLAALQKRLATSMPYEVISGYRSPASNAQMHARSGGVAKKSLHMQGKAIDIRVQGRDLAHIQRTAIAMGTGGVGYYPSSDFVHVDTGAPRHWRGS